LLLLLFSHALDTNEFVFLAMGQSSLSLREMLGGLSGSRSISDGIDMLGRTLEALSGCSKAPSREVVVVVEPLTVAAAPLRQPLHPRKLWDIDEGRITNLQW
jgi:hypothetical protein